ncbi:MAG TPA: sensor histidine kinase, partial [Flavobacteriales bacterium]|nr:sensor histidine kinase [Flavobacteriales bacterium]
MTDQELRQFAQLIRKEAGALLSTWREEVAKLPSARHLTVPVLNDHIPALLEELAVAFETRSDVSITEALIEGTPVAHGEQRVADGFDIVEVVAEYNILRGCLHDVAVTNGLNMAGNAFHILNRVFDGAIGLAVASYATQQAQEVLHRREEYLAFVAHDLRTPLNAISLATSVLETSLPAVGEGAQMVKTLHRNVGQLQALVRKVLEENTNLETEVGVKLELRHFDLWPLVEGLIHDIKPVGGSGSTVLRNTVPDDLIVFADASLLKRVFQNLIGNAITYTPRGEVNIG